MQRGAIVDPTGCYRYRLWRSWAASQARLVFVMLNPSTADAHHDDPTLRRCLGFAQRWSYGHLDVVNLFAWRATDPYALRQAVDPVGAENDRHLLQTADRGDAIILAWGNGGAWNDRGQQVLTLLHQLEKPLYCLGKTRQQQPRHPLYLKTQTPLIPW